VFHDSEGFESGSSSETGETVLTFIKDRSSEIRPDLQLHAIWYCIPLPDLRGLSENELQMFERFESTVPTIIVFTQRDKKVDSLLTDLMPHDEFTDLDIKRLQPVAEAKAQEHYLRLKDEIVARGLSKARFAVLGGLDKNIEESSQQCRGLVQLTENALPAMSRLLLASVHVNNLQSRIRFAMRRILHRVMSLQPQRGAGSPGGNIFSKLLRKLVPSSESRDYPFLQGVVPCLVLYLPHWGGWIFGGNYEEEASSERLSSSSERLSSERLSSLSESWERLSSSSWELSWSPILEAFHTPSSCFVAPVCCACLHVVNCCNSCFL